eukprot:scaffold8052_cov95-Phaeocystis_antarctica.AAC.1
MLVRTMAWCEAAPVQSQAAAPRPPLCWLPPRSLYLGGAGIDARRAGLRADAHHGCAGAHAVAHHTVTALAYRLARTIPTSVLRLLLSFAGHRPITFNGTLNVSSALESESSAVVGLRRSITTDRRCWNYSASMMQLNDNIETQQ